MNSDESALAAALLQLAEHGDRLARLDEREGSHHHQACGQLAELTRMVGRIAADASRDETSAADAHNHADGYTPVPTPRWWRLDGQDREDALDRLRGWVAQVYRPGYGQLAATLGSCWEQHQLCLYGLDLLSELWSVLYVQPDRTGAVVSAQAEFQARIVPAIAEQLMIETTRCAHSSGSAARMRRSLP